MKAHPLPGKRLPLLGIFVFIVATPLPASTWTCDLVPSALEVATSLTGNSDGNGLLEPGETVDLETSWSQREVCHWSDWGLAGCYRRPPFGLDCPLTLTETGSASPTSGDYLLLDHEAQYAIATRTGPGSCAPNQDCYSIFVPVPILRPARHWDAAFDEVLSGTRSATTTWKVHVGDSFADVPRTHPFYRPIEALLHNGVTSGCTLQDYCPDGAVTRSEVAILLAKALKKRKPNSPFVSPIGPSAPVPASGFVNGQPYDCAAGGVSLFEDVAPTDSLCRHAHYLAAQSIMKACRPNAFCPAETISRVVMAVYVARAMVGAYSVPPCYSYSHFADIPASNDFCQFVNLLWSRGVVTGCGPDKFCPDGIVTRDQMAKFLVKGFGLQLNGP